ncbi:MAG: gliding motility-associated ABC transporter permease subunit GldF, partial [Pseudopedobacter saltans]
MWMICTKECRQFFSSLTGYIAIVTFLLLNGLFLFVFPNTSLLDYGYASLDGYFHIAPWIFLFLIPTITMKSFSEEYKTGTFEMLKTYPLTPAQIVWGKFFGALFIVFLSLLPTVIYAVSMQKLSAVGGIDTGS